MARLQRIEGIVNDTISSYGHVKIMPRSLPQFVDLLLRGQVRFGKRTGNSVSVMNPDNTFRFETVPPTKSRQITLTGETPWIVNDCILSLGPDRELHFVEDVIDSTILLADETELSYTDTSRVLLHSYPLQVAVDFLSGASVITVKSLYPLVNGDVFSFLQNSELIQSLSEVKASKATFQGTTGDPLFPNIYSLELEEPITRDFLTGDTVYIRAYPAYISSTVRVPNSLFSSEPVGPFLIDFLSGNLLEGKAFNETAGMKATNRTGGYVIGSSGEYQTVDKNFVVIDRPWSPHYPMFWELGDGTMRITPDRLIMRVDDQNRFFVGVKCVPHIPGGRQWKASLQSNDDCTIRFVFKPHDPQEFTLISGISQNVTIDIPAGEDVTIIEINILSTSDICSVSMSDWSPVKDTIDQLQYTIMAEATGEATYQSTGLLIKPYFLGSDFLRSNWDTGDKFDGGKIYF